MKLVADRPFADPAAAARKLGNAHRFGDVLRLIMGACFRQQIHVVARDHAGPSELVELANDSRAPQTDVMRDLRCIHRPQDFLSCSFGGRPDRSLFHAFTAAKREAEATSKFVRVGGDEGGRFAVTGRGDVNTYPLAAELFAVHNGLLLSTTKGTQFQRDENRAKIGALSSGSMVLR
jgi:hypothetical protein